MSLLLSLGLLTAQQELPSYDHALRCMGLTTISVDLLAVNRKDPAYGQAFEASMGWSWAVAMNQRRHGLTAEQADAKAEKAIDIAETDLAAGGSAVRSELAKCLKTAPPTGRVEVSKTRAESRR